MSVIKKQLKKFETNKDIIQLQMEQTLDREFKAWYPRSIDRESGGFFSDFDYMWQKKGKQDKMIVTQARHVWSCANGLLFYKESPELLSAAAHGFEFLKNKMWDEKYGGFYELVDCQGNPVPNNEKIIKNAYGNSFCIYGLAKYYEASGDSKVLQLAQDTFHWMEKHSFDPAYGGYFQFMTQEGTQLTNGFKPWPPKDFNSMIHILECFTELYNVWKDPLLKTRLFSMLLLIRDKISSDKGYLRLYFNPDWTRFDGDNSTEDHFTVGHDIETAHLMLEAAKALGMENDQGTLGAAKRMVDHSIANSWDNENGALVDGDYRYTGGTPIAVNPMAKNWWTQAESFNSLLLMHTLFPKDGNDYYEKFCMQWNYCMNYLIDHQYGGWYLRGWDVEPEMKNSIKSSIWKCNYHTTRSLINSIRKLRVLP